MMTISTPVFVDFQVLNLEGKGSDLAPFPYFKQTVFVSVIIVGIIANLVANALGQGPARERSKSLHTEPMYE